MDTEIFPALKEGQYNELKDSLALVTVLIAGADDNIDEQELNWAEKLTQIRSYTKPESLNNFYEDVEQGFHKRLEELIKELPGFVDKRQEVISSRLANLNTILPLLDNEIGHQIYDSLTSFAKHIAKASGGFLRFASISKAEKEWIHLPMVDPIILEELGEEEPETE
jgi:hypothetical protein